MFSISLIKIYTNKAAYFGKVAPRIILLGIMLAKIMADYSAWNKSKNNFQSYVRQMQYLTVTSSFSTVPFYDCIGVLHRNTLERCLISWYAAMPHFLTCKKFVAFIQLIILSKFNQFRSSTFHFSRTKY